MRIDRRTMLAGGVALAAAPVLAKPRAARADWYEQAIIIDALGGAGDPMGRRSSCASATGRGRKWSRRA